MQLVLDAVEAIGATPSGEFATSAPVTGTGPVALGPLEVALDLHAQPALVRWAVANRDDSAVDVRSVSLVYRVEDPVGELRMLRHGYQSWSESAVAVLGIDADPSLTEGSIRLVRGMHHADEERAAPGELRSECVTLLIDGDGDVVLAGFEDGTDHDGTFRVRPAGHDPDRPGTVTLRAEAHLGGARIGAGERRPLHAVVCEEGVDPSELLEGWAGRFGAVAAARTGAPFQAGWCSWYHYFHGVGEAEVRANLALAGNWPFEVFQVDDGYQSAIGDWLTTNERFPTSVDGLAAAIADAGYVPGIWLAPFLAGPGSRLATDHPDWIARWKDGDTPLVGMWNEGWGGPTHTLDTSNPEVLEHLEATARALVDAGFRYLKLDFTYAPSLDGRWHDPTRTPAQRVRAGFDAIRRGAGDDVFLLGCGAPLGATVGAVDGMRIGPDVAPSWEPAADTWQPPGYGAVVPSTRSAWRATLARSFMHRRLWLNDPDCLMLRTTATDMAPATVEAWARAVGASGGMAIVSDDLALLDDRARRLLDDVLAVGREVDDLARRGRPPRCPDLLDHPTPTQLDAGPIHLAGDPAAGTATIARD
jgi:alpha-galactosidase